MAAKKKQKISQAELIAALTDAGYELDGFSRKPETLVIRLSPNHLIEGGQHVAEKVCAANHLQARCNTFENLLIVSVKGKHVVPRGAASGQPRCAAGGPSAANHDSTVTPHDKEHSS